MSCLCLSTRWVWLNYLLGGCSLITCAVGMAYLRSGRGYIGGSAVLQLYGLQFAVSGHLAGLKQRRALHQVCHGPVSQLDALWCDARPVSKLNVLRCNAKRCLRCGLGRSCFRLWQR